MFVFVVPQTGARALILSPTRELAQQTDHVVRDLARFTDLTTALLIGGESLEQQFFALSKSPDMYNNLTVDIFSPLSFINEIFSRFFIYYFDVFLFIILIFFD